MRKLLGGIQSHEFKSSGHENEKCNISQAQSNCTSAVEEEHSSAGSIQEKGGSDKLKCGANNDGHYTSLLFISTNIVLAVITLLTFIFSGK